AIFLVTRARWRDARTWALLGIALGWLGLEIQRAPGLRSDVALRIDSLSVGAGSCYLVRSDKAAMLWDCGSLRPGLGRTMIPRAIHRLGVWEVPTVVITHPDMDHYNALADVAPALGVRHIILGKAF